MVEGKDQLFEHAQRYIREVMAPRLREEGFCSFKGEDIHWYRLVNNEVLQTVYFVTRSKALHSFMEICYGCHPLFIPPVFQKSPYFHAMPSYEQMNNRVPEQVAGSTLHGFHSLQICGAVNRPYRVPDVLIMCPEDRNKGLDILELIFPILDQTTTPHACYEMHLNRRKDEIEMGNTYAMSPYFVDEVLFWEDKERYAYCQAYLKDQLERQAHFQRLQRPINKTLQIEMEKCALLDSVFREEKRQEYIRTFLDRETELRQLLRKSF